MTMWKTAAVGAAALVIAGSAMVYAQQRQGGGPGGLGGPRDVPRMGGWHPSAQDMSAFAVERIAARPAAASRARLRRGADRRPPRGARAQRRPGEGLAAVRAGLARAVQDAARAL